jgi:hypothetical protein
MNQASWRRILQRAGDELPGEGAAIINMQDHARRARHPQEPDEGDTASLDYELTRALDRAGRRNRVPGQPSVSPSAPLTARNPYVSMQPVPMVLPPQGVKKSGSGARNVVAISLSVAVVGLAFHQISSQWSESRSTGKTEETAQVSDVRQTSAVFADTTRPTGVRVDLNKSLAQPQSEPAPSQDAAPSRDDRQALYDDMEKAVKSYLDREKSQAAAKTKLAATTASFSGSEQAMLKRGREMMERGAVAGARLIFEHLAEQNSALGAFALAQTFDAGYIKQNSLGAEADEAQAAHWYQRAVELGSNGG